MHRKIVLFFSLMFLGIKCFAQYSAGMIGALNVPTAENKEPGTVYIGGNFIPKDMLPAYFTNQYNTGNYFVTANIFSFLELSYRMTILRGEDERFSQQDRSFSVRLQALREGKYCPGFAVGAYDPMFDEGVSAYESYYAVLTKGFDLGKSRLSATLGYYLPIHNNKDAGLKHNYKGIFGAVSFSPSFCRDLDVIAEYDSRKFNVGASIKFLKCLRAHVLTQEFQNVSAGLRYECELWH